MTRPPVTYHVNLADLELFADAASELDDYKEHLSDKPAGRARIISMVERMHETIGRAAGADEKLVYGEPDEASGQHPATPEVAP